MFFISGTFECFLKVIYVCFLSVEGSRWEVDKKVRQAKVEGVKNVTGGEVKFYHDIFFFP